ncbi:MAG: YfhO family protein, partial [Anaerolineales bacterium]|nr:YfhO family protein [Anaerolineales bacterium]
MKRLQTALPYLALAAAWALFFWRFAAPDPADRLTYPPGDFSQQFGVFRAVAYQALLRGQLPLWAGCLYSGYPFQADPQSQLFYPPIWLIFAFLRLQGWGHFPLGALVAEVALHYLLASLFMFWFLRALRLRPAAALAGALVFAYGGYLTGSPPLQTGILETVTWLPLALLAAERLAAGGRTPPLALAALALAVAGLAGHPQTFLYCALLALAYFAVRAWQAGWRPARLAAHAAALALLALALAAVQLLPSAHFILHSTRASVSFEQAGHGFPFADVLQFLIPGVVSYWSPLYVGILPLGLAVLGLSRRSAGVWFWAAVAVIGLLLSFGTKAVLYDAAYWLVPGYRLFRSQERLAVAVSFALAVLAAHGVEALLAPPSERPRVLPAVLKTGGALFALGWLLLAVLVYARQLALPAGAELVERAGLFILAAGLALLALAAAARLPGRPWVPGLILAVIVIDLFAANRGTNVVAPYDPYPYNPLLDAIITEGGFFRVQDDVQLPGHAGCAYGYRAVEGVAPYQVASYARFQARVPEPVRWQLLGVRYLVTWRAELTEAGPAHQPIVVTARGDVPDDRGNVTTVHRLGSTPRRAFLVHQVEVAEGGEDDVYARLAAPGFDPLGTAVVQAPVSVAPADPAADPVVLADEPGRLRLTTASEAAGLLVVSEAYFPGWQARVDGAPAPVLPADGALLAVTVPAGSHTVELTYRPPMLLAGAALSGLA